ncbi:uncharacterized protein LOC106868669 [Octopus bimaculoides]|uniref:Claudin n=1 Tax=Octopus bimaculoides TaxID=37653 RepID=A0A0L8HUS6_OCTBM|nr:uncharacterized protein LOC106868669 [Octopus bimaculoides]|eukprot:XP_014769531.1 PREDICTED: uncharacterized protein LOC106868669 [Octopus bimaculoides]
MIVGFQYMAMTITGVFHLGIGVLCFIISMVGFSTKLIQYHPIGHLSNVTSAAACIVSLWIITIGIFGILAGLKSNTEIQTRRMKITYMVLAILSACIFSIGGMSAFSGHAAWIQLSLRYESYYPLFCVGSFAMFAEFILAIVSSSICCCCSQAKNNVVVIHQNQATEFVNPSINTSYSPITHYSPNVADPYMPQEFNEMK